MIHTFKRIYQTCDNFLDQTFFRNPFSSLWVSWSAVIDLKRTKVRTTTTGAAPYLVILLNGLFRHSNLSLAMALILYHCFIYTYLLCWWIILQKVLIKCIYYWLDLFRWINFTFKCIIINYTGDVQGTMTTPIWYPLHPQRSHNNTQANWISENTYTPTSALYIITHNKVHMYKHL